MSQMVLSSCTLCSPEGLGPDTLLPFSLQHGRRAGTGSHRPHLQATWASPSQISLKGLATRPGSPRTTTWPCSGPAWWRGPPRPRLQGRRLPQPAGREASRSGTSPVTRTHASHPSSLRASPGPRRTVGAGETRWRPQVPLAREGQGSGSRLFNCLLRRVFFSPSLAGGRTFL